MSWNRAIKQLDMTVRGTWIIVKQHFADESTTVVARLVRANRRVASRGEGLVTILPARDASLVFKFEPLLNYSFAKFELLWIEWLNAANESAE
jgi:hypothetical protein